MNTTLLRTLASVGTPRHPWSEYSDIIRNSVALVDADRGGFTVLTSTGNRRVELPNGLTEALYEYLAPWCDESERGLMAKGCLQHSLDVDWHTWDRFNGYACHEIGSSLEELLPGLLSQHGFRRVAASMEDALVQFQNDFPPTPSWYEIEVDTFILQFGSHGRWRFDSRANVQIAVISALAKNDWKPVQDIKEWHSRAFLRRQSKEPNQRTLHTMQIKFALNELRKKTRGVLVWHEYRTNGVSWEPLI